jgi:hypothetical protein
MFPQKFLPVSIHYLTHQPTSYKYLKYATRSWQIPKAKAKTPRIGISSKQTGENSGLQNQRKAKLFKRIIENGAGIAYKKGLGVGETFVNLKTRGKAVAIGPLEYCGSGIPMMRPRGKRPGAHKKESEKEKVL